MEGNKTMNKSIGKSKSEIENKAALGGRRDILVYYGGKGCGRR